MGLALLGDKIHCRRAAGKSMIWECVADAEFATRGRHRDAAWLQSHAGLCAHQTCALRELDNEKHKGATGARKEVEIHARMPDFSKRDYRAEA
jgi:hypothetical protein